MNEAPPLYSFARAICRVSCTMLFDLKVYGTENVPRSGGVLLAANHASYLDPVMVGVHLRRPLSFLAKSELFENPFVNRIIRGLNAFPVRQGAGDVGAMKETIRRLQEGHALTIFPEGSRTTTGEMLPIEPGIGLVVRRAGVPVVPVGIEGTFEAWPPDRMFFRPAPIRVKFGPPMKLGGVKAAEVTERVGQAIRDLLADLRADAAGDGQS